MGAIRLPDELQRIIDKQVADSRVASATDFVEEAVRRLLEDARAEEEEIAAVAQAGAADIEVRRYTTIATPENAQRVRDRIMARVRNNLRAKE